MEASAFKYSEKLLAEQLGLSRVDLKTLRDQLIVDFDWRKDGYGCVVISDSGIAKIIDALGGSVDVDLTGSLMGAPGGDNGAVEPELSLEKNGACRMTVTKIPLNPRMILADGDAGKDCLVDVGSNANFVVGDTIEAVPHSSQAGFWRFVGPMPRDRRRIGGRAL